MIEQQPEGSNFYFRTTPEGKLITEAPAGGPPPCIEGSQTGQGYYYCGMPTLFLTKIHLAMGGQPCEEGARWLFERSLRFAKDRYASPPSGKSAVGAAVLYTITGDERAREAACEFADYMTGRQRPDGAWDNPSSDSEIVLLDHTAEMVVWLNEIVGALGGL